MNTLLSYADGLLEGRALYSRHVESGETTLHALIASVRRESDDVGVEGDFYKGVLAYLYLVAKAA